MKKLFLFIYFLFITIGLKAQCWQSISGGESLSAGIKTDGTLWAWGFNVAGILGTGSTFTVVNFSEQIGSANNLQSVSVGGIHIMAIKSIDSLFCWDGTLSGKLLNPDVFVYYIKATDNNKTEFTKKGNVTLIK